MKRFLVGCLTCGLAALPVVALVAPAHTLAWLSFRFDFNIVTWHLILCVGAAAFLFDGVSMFVNEFELRLHREHPEWWK